VRSLKKVNEGRSLLRMNLGVFIQGVASLKQTAFWSLEGTSLVNCLLGGLMKDDGEQGSEGLFYFEHGFLRYIFEDEPVDRRRL
jgi:hypothetical protein